MALKGVEIVILPAAFNMTTGPAHWELSIRMRALDNQIFYVGAAPARNMNASYIALEIQEFQTLGKNNCSS